jgi:hypothetical protein
MCIPILEGTLKFYLSINPTNLEFELVTRALGNSDRDRAPVPEPIA